MVRGKTIRVWYWIVTILLAAFMLFSAFSELMQTESAKQVMIDLGYPVYLNYILGVAKVLGAVAILQTRWRTIKEWAYAGFVFDVVGAGASMVLAGQGMVSLLFILPFLALIFVSYALWKKTDN